MLDEAGGEKRFLLYDKTPRAYLITVDNGRGKRYNENTIDAGAQPKLLRCRLFRDGTFEPVS